MSKKQSIFKRLKIIVSRNPIIIWAITWVSIMPSLGSFFFLNYLYSNLQVFRHMDFLTMEISIPYLLVTALIMGLALMPTTLIAIVSGFLFGWVSLPFLIIAYTLASIIGYKAGRQMDDNSLDILLEKYPKTKMMILERQDQMNELIFFLRLSPVIPFALSNLLFALLRADLAKVVWVGLLGMLPRTTMAFITGLMATSLLEAVREGTSFYQFIGITLLLLISIWGLVRVISKWLKPVNA